MEVSMDALQEFMQYAGEFERTLADDDWSRLRRFFNEDAVYEVKAPFGCRLVGPEAIFGGIRKSLNGFDRHFPGRDIKVTSGPEVAPDELKLGWEVTYSLEGKPPFVLRGRSEARYRDGKISYLADSYDPSVSDEFAAWQKKTGVALDPSYT
jgi:SnoaL-like domain